MMLERFAPRAKRSSSSSGLEPLDEVGECGRHCFHDGALVMADILKSRTHGFSLRDVAARCAREEPAAAPHRRPRRVSASCFPRPSLDAQPALQFRPRLTGCGQAEDHFPQQLTAVCRKRP